MLDAALVCLALNLYHEARGEPVEGQIAVALVTINRAKRKPEKICDVVYEYAQFSWTLNPYAAVTNNETFLKMQHVAQRAWHLKDFTQGADHFHAADMKQYPGWASKLKYVGRWGNHLFYRK